MIIRLNEIPEEGLDYEFSDKNKELKAKLEVYLADEPFTASLRLLPIGDGFDLTGSLKGDLPLSCSFCAKDFKLPFKEAFHEVLFLGDKKSRKFDEKGSLSDPDLFVRTLTSQEFDLDEFLHEINGLAVPFQPACQESCLGLCSVCGEDKNTTKCDCESKENMQSSPFSVLKELKVN